jgi:hypothetical protein
LAAGLNGRAAREPSPNRSGLPDHLKSGVEALSGVSMDAVRVHFNSSQPARRNALAYAQGTDIHLGPGQERHLPHEAWHVAQQAQGRVRPTSVASDGGRLNTDPSLEREADIMGARSRDLAPAQLRSAAPPRGNVPHRRGTRSGSFQRVVPGLETILSPADVDEAWVDLYLADILSDTAHLWDEDIIAYLNEKDPDWHKDVGLQNTGGNHWDVRLLTAEPVVKIRTRPDGNCGCHAIGAVLDRASVKADIDDYQAKGEIVLDVRRSVMARMAGDRAEIRKRIAIEVQRSPFAALTGFGPSLMDAVLAREREAREHSNASSPTLEVRDREPDDLPDDRVKRFSRLIEAGVPVESVRRMMLEAGVRSEETPALLEKCQASAKSSGSASGDVVSEPKATGDLRTQLAELEQEVMDLYTIAWDEEQFLKDIQAAVNYKHEPTKHEIVKTRKALAAAKKEETPNLGRIVELTAMLAKLESEWTKSTEAIKKNYAKYEKASKARIAKVTETFGTTLEGKRGEWMKLMSQLVGTHASGSTDYSAPLHRHDLKSGAYGRAPTPEDALSGHRHMEVLHGHGGWDRTGLAAEGRLNPNMQGLTSLGEIVEAANVRRAGKKLPPIKPEQVDLAFVDHHGISIMGDAVARGAYPRVMPLPTDLHRKVLDNIALVGKGASREKIYEHFVNLCSVLKTDKAKEAYAKKRGFTYTPERKWTDLPLWEAYHRVVGGTAGGASAQYVDILNARTHGAVKFPNSELGHLMGFDQNTERMKMLKSPDYKVSLAEDFESFGRTGRPTVALSTAITDRLAELQVGDQPIRIVWAACRAEHWPAGFNFNTFYQWVKTAAEHRKVKRGW